MLKYHIQTIEVPAAGASDITFNNISQIYDDLQIVYSLRDTSASLSNDGHIVINGSQLTFRSLYGTGVNTNSFTQNFIVRPIVGNGSTSNTFSSVQVTISNYSNSTSVKPVSLDTVSEGNNTEQYQSIAASITSSSGPVTSVTFRSASSSTLAQYSSASLYGIKRGADGVTKTGPLATGGTVTTSGGYTYHTFTSSGTFSVPVSTISSDVLIVGGGGGGGSDNGGGGGAGGYLAQSMSIVPGSYPVVIGGGGAGATSYGNNGQIGGNSTAFNLTAFGGGGGGTRLTSSPYDNPVRKNGGSGGGGSYGNNAIGLGTPGQGNNGGLGLGNTSSETYQQSGGGGGAGAAGSNAVVGSTNGIPGAGGAGLQWLNGSYYAGGGGGANGALGGIGGGGNASTNYPSPPGGNGTPNTGGGGGGQGNSPSQQGGSGGSGIVIIRYPTPA